MLYDYKENLLSGYSSFFDNDVGTGNCNNFAGY